MGADGELDDAVSLDGAAILARVESIDPIIRAHAEEGERARRLATPVVDALRWAGVFRLAMPKAWGGPEVDICTQVRIIERVARADASAGWCAMIGSESGFFASYLEESAARRLYPKLDAVTAGFQGPAGTLHVAEGGYRLSGRWPFGSGACHADVILARGACDRCGRHPAHDVIGEARTSGGDVARRPMAGARHVATGRSRGQRKPRLRRGIPLRPRGIHLVPGVWLV